MLIMLYHFGSFVGGSDLYLTGTEAGVELADWFPYDSPPKMEDNKTANWVVLEYFQVCDLFCRSFHLWYPTGILLPR